MLTQPIKVKPQAQQSQPIETVDASLTADLPLPSVEGKTNPALNGYGTRHKYSNSHRCEV